MFINKAGPRLLGEDGRDGPARRVSAPFDQAECQFYQGALGRRLYVRLNQLTQQDLRERGAALQHQHHNQHQHQHQQEHHQHQHHQRPHQEQQNQKKHQIQQELKHRAQKRNHPKPPPPAQPQLKMELQPRRFPGDEFDDYYMQTRSPQPGSYCSSASLGWTPALPSPPAQATTPAHVSGTTVAGPPLHPSHHANDKEDLSAGAQMFWTPLDSTVPAVNLYALASHPFDTGADHRQHSIQMLNHPGHGYGYVNLHNGLEYFDGMPSMPTAVNVSPSGTYSSSFTSHGTSESDSFANVGSYYPYATFPVPVASPPLSHSHVALPVVDSPFVPQTLHASARPLENLNGMDYVSPDKLRLNPSPVPVAARSSSESFVSDTMAQPKLDMGNNPFDGDFPPAPLSTRSRRGLPDRPRPRARAQLRPAPASSMSRSAPSISPPAGSSECLPASASSSSPPLRRPRATASKHHSTLVHRTKMADLQPKSADTGGSLQSRRSEKDNFLMDAREAGKSYKQIRAEGNFKEAESTLRGRYRTLTKPRDERVRKPEWKDKDVELLKQAIRHFSKGNNPFKCKHPWKQVADYIFHHGGSYRFGNATCHKRWDELVLAYGEAALD